MAGTWSNTLFLCMGANIIHRLYGCGDLEELGVWATLELQKGQTIASARARTTFKI